VSEGEEESKSVWEEATCKRTHQPTSAGSKSIWPSASSFAAADSRDYLAPEREMGTSHKERRKEERAAEKRIPRPPDAPIPVPAPAPVPVVLAAAEQHWEPPFFCSLGRQNLNLSRIWAGKERREERAGTENYLYVLGKGPPATIGACGKGHLAPWNDGRVFIVVPLLRGVTAN